MTAIAEVLPVSSQTDLVRSAARGDALAFERLLVTRADWAFRIARAMLGDESEARDATQNAFVSAWRELPRLRDPEAFDPWLRRILVNACRAQMRVRQRVREIRLDATVDPAADPAWRWPHPCRRRQRLRIPPARLVGAVRPEDRPVQPDRLHA